MTKRTKSTKSSKAPDAATGDAGAPAEQAEMEPIRDDDEAPGDSTAEQVAALEDKLLRAKADAANLQRRLATEHAEALRFAKADLIRAILPVLDDLERSLQTEVSSADGRSLREGVQLVHDKLLKVLGDYGVEAIDPLHAPFDPVYHEAMMRRPSAEHPCNTVLEVFMKGYRMGDRVIRPARVVVSTQAGGPGEAEPVEARGEGDGA